MHLLVQTTHILVEIGMELGIGKCPEKEKFEVSWCRVADRF